AEVLDVKVGCQRTKELRWFAEGVEERVRRTRGYGDARPSSGLDAVGPRDEPEPPRGHDEGFVVLTVNVLGWSRGARRHGCLDEAQPVLSVRAVLDDAAADRPTAGLLALVRGSDMHGHGVSFAV